MHDVVSERDNQLGTCMSFQTLALAAVIVAAGAIQYILMVQALQDLVHRPRVRGGNKMSWALLILCVPIAGALLYSSMGPTSFLRPGHAGEARDTGPASEPDPVDFQAPRPENVTPFRPRSASSVRGRTTARRAGLTRSRAHNTGNLRQMRRTGS